VLSQEHLLYPQALRSLLQALKTSAEKIEGD